VHDICAAVEDGPAASALQEHIAVSSRDSCCSRGNPGDVVRFAPAARGRQRDSWAHRCCFGEFNYVESETERSLFQSIGLFAHVCHASTL